MKKNKELKQAFVVGPSALKKLTKLLQDHIGKVKISSECADGIDREFETINHLIDYENPKSKEICCVRLSARSDDYSKSATIILPFLFRQIRIDIPEQTDIELRREIEDIIEGTRPWYNRLACIRPVRAPYLIFLFVLLGLKSVRWWLFTQKSKVEVPDLLNFSILVLFLLIIIGIVVFFASRLWNYCFPQAVFTIGQGKSRFEYKERIRWAVIIGYVVALSPTATDLLGELIWQAIINIR